MENRDEPMGLDNYDWAILLDEGFRFDDIVEGQMPGSSSGGVNDESTTEINLPGGIVFTPSDQDLIQYYLKKKATNEANEKVDVHTLDVDPFESHPKQLYDSYQVFAGIENELYCYTKKRKSGKYESTAIGGFWKTSPDFPIRSKSEIIGQKRYLVFYEGTRNSNTKSDWVIHEYRLNKKVMENDWLLCKVTNKISKRKRKSPEGASEPSSLPNVEERVKIMSDDILNAIGRIDVRLSKLENEVCAVRGSQERMEAQLQVWQLQQLKQPQAGPYAPRTDP